MIVLDMRTIFFTYVITSSVCTFVIVLLWLQNRRRFAGMALLVSDYLLMSLATLLFVLRGIIPDAISIVLANSLIMAGPLLGYMALERFAGKPGSQTHNYILIVLLTGIHAYLTYVEPNLRGRTLNTATALFILFSQCAWLALVRVGPAHRRQMRGLGFVFIAYVLFSGCRIIESFMVTQNRTDFFRPDTFDALAMITYQVLFLLLTYILVLMINRYLHEDVLVQEEKFHKAFHSSPYAILLGRLSDGRIFEVNDGFKTMSGYEAEDIKGKTAMDLHLWNREEDRAEVWHDLNKSVGIHGREYDFRCKSGRIMTGLFSAEFIEINHEPCFICNIGDITDRKLAEDDLQRSEAFLNSIIEQSPNAMWISDERGELIRINPACLEMLKISEDEVVGKYNILRDNIVEKQGWMPLVRRVFQNGEAARFEIVYDTAQLTGLELEHRAFVILDTTIFPIKDREGRVTNAVIQHMDITERRRAQEEIRILNADLEEKVRRRTRELHDSQLALLNVVDDLNETAQRLSVVNQALEAANKEIASFSYSVSHDLRAPLRSIDGFSQALLEDYNDKALDETGRSYLARIRRGTQHMGQLIDDMLNLSRVTQSELHREFMDLSTMVRTIADTYGRQNPDRPASFNIQGGIMIRGDSRLMNIAMTNLMDNAWKFAGTQEKPYIEFGKTLRDEKEVFFIRDNGVGFDMAFVEKLFGVFQRLHRTDEFPGTGIGLATVHRIIRRHGGQIWAEGKPGQGATFYFTVPD